jgi:argininosuccinate lyase
LIRAKSGRVVGALAGLLSVLKGLPLAYSKDMQEDKEPVFEAANTWLLSLGAMTGMIREMVVNAEVMKEAVSRGHATATDLADWLVRVLDMPFRHAHYVTGLLVRLADREGCSLMDLSLAAMQSVEPRITADVFKVLEVEKSVASRKSLGGTAPMNVRRAAAAARKTYL